MAPWTEFNLSQQYERAKRLGWLPYFDTAAKIHGFDAHLLLAIASRETNLQNIRGDLRNGVYHGYGLMQVDVGSNPGFCSSWKPDAVEASIDCGAAMLAAKRKALLQHGIEDLRAIAASYNTGEGNVLKSLAHGLDPDVTTTGKDYGQDVLNRMRIFQKLREV